MATALTLLSLSVLLVFAAEATLHGYLDPGSTNLLLQGVVGGIAAVLVVVKTFWRRMLTGFQRPERGDGPGGSIS